MAQDASSSSHQTVIIMQHEEKEGNQEERKMTHWSLKQFFINQLTIDKLQTDYMLEYYLNCYKIHMKKKLQRKKRKEGFDESFSPSYVESDFDEFLDLIETFTISQSDFPRDQSDAKPLCIGEEGWLILSHWMQPLFKKENNVTCLNPTCELCLQHDGIRQAFEKFKSERVRLFEGTCHTPLGIFQKFVDLWNQLKFLGSTRYALSDHGCANVFASGILNCTLTHFVFGKDLQGKNPQEPHMSVCILNALEQNTSIYSIDLSGLIIIHDSVAKAIASMIRKKKSLKRLVISKLSLSKVVYSTYIIDSLVESSITQLEIYIYDGNSLKSNFRFLEHTNRSDLKKLASKSLDSFMVTSYNFTFPIDYCYLFEEILKNKSINFLQYSINDIDGIVRAEDEVNEFQQFIDKLYSVIEKTKEFYFKDHYLYNTTPQQEYHIVKNAKRMTSYTPYLRFLQVPTNETEDVSLSEIGYLNVKDFMTIGFPRIVPFFNRVVKLSLKLTRMNDEQLEIFSRAILNAPLLEKLILLKLRKVGKENLFAEYFKVQNKTKLRKLIISDVANTDNTVILDVFSTFLDLEYFPYLTALYIRGREMDFDLKASETLVNSIKKQESHYPKGLRKLELLEGSITGFEVTEYLLKSLTNNRLLSTLGISQAPLKNVDSLVDFIINNKSVTELKINYSDCEEIPEELLCKENEITPAFLKVFGAFQINWQLTAIDWYMEYYYNTFEFGTANHVGERFLVERIMNRNKAQKHINSLMQSILSQLDKFNQLSDISIITTC